MCDVWERISASLGALALPQQNVSLAIFPNFPKFFTHSYFKFQVHFCKLSQVLWGRVGYL